MECSLSYCDHSPSVVVRPSVHNFLVNTLASTNINQSAPNLVRMYMTTGFSPVIFEGVVAFSGVARLVSITNVTQSAT